MALTETKLNRFKSTHIRTLKFGVNRNCEGGLENESTKVVTVGNFSIQRIHLVLYCWMNCLLLARALAGVK